MSDGKCVFYLNLNTVNEQLLVTSMAREFQTVGAEQRKARSAKRVLVVNLYSNGTANERRWWADPRSLMWRLRYDGVDVLRILYVRTANLWFCNKQSVMVMAHIFSHGPTPLPPTRSTTSYSSVDRPGVIMQPALDILDIRPTTYKQQNKTASLWMVTNQTGSYVSVALTYNKQRPALGMFQVFGQTGPPF